MPLAWRRCGYLTYVLIIYCDCLKQMNGSLSPILSEWTNAPCVSTTFLILIICVALQTGLGFRSTFRLLGLFQLPQTKEAAASPRNWRIIYKKFIKQVKYSISKGGSRIIPVSTLAHVFGLYLLCLSHIVFDHLVATYLGVLGMGASNLEIILLAAGFQLLDGHHNAALGKAIGLVAAVVICPTDYKVPVPSGRG